MAVSQFFIDCLWCSTTTICTVRDFPEATDRWVNALECFLSDQVTGSKTVGLVDSGREGASLNWLHVHVSYRHILWLSGMVSVYSSSENSQPSCRSTPTALPLGMQLIHRGYPLAVHFAEYVAWPPRVVDSRLCDAEVNSEHDAITGACTFVADRFTDIELGWLLLLTLKTRSVHSSCLKLLLGKWTNRELEMVVRIQQKNW